MHIAKSGTVLQTKCCFANSSESARQHQASNCLSRPVSVPAWQLLNTNAQTSCETWMGHMLILAPTVKLSVCRTVHQSHSELSTLANKCKICLVSANKNGVICWKLGSYLFIGVSPVNSLDTEESSVPLGFSV